MSLGIHNNVFKNFVLNENSLVVDLGAYRGAFTGFVLDRYNCFVEAYEPNKKIFRLQHDKLAFFDKAVYDGSRVRYLTVRGKSGNTIMLNSGVEIETLDIRDVTNKPIDLIKINIEGAEHVVLRRARLENIKQILVEFHLHEMYNTPQEEVDKTVDHVINAGFRAKELTDNEFFPSYFFTKL